MIARDTLRGIIIDAADPDDRDDVAIRGTLVAGLETVLALCPPAEGGSIATEPTASEAAAVVYFSDFNGEHFVDPLLAAMAERVEVDLASLESPAQLDALQHACVNCAARIRCASWHRSSTDDVEYREFCANVDTLDGLWTQSAIQRGDLRKAAFKTAVGSETDSTSEESHRPSASRRRAMEPEGQQTRPVPKWSMSAPAPATRQPPVA